MRRASYSRCKDCGTDKIIQTARDSELTEILCKNCLSSRAQLQSIKEDKLSFSALLTKIRKETERRVHSEIHQQRYHIVEYRGANPYAVYKPEYWTEQLKQA